MACNVQDFYMDVEEARKLVVESGLRLVREGLVSRTWGNISVRLDHESFLITPSGISYEGMKPENIVRVFMADLRAEGPYKPSSERALHQEIYREKPEIRAIIHTHQTAASAVSAARKPIDGLAGEMLTVIGPHVHTAPYALPGTKKLARSAAIAIKGSNAVLLANHGAVCVGRNMDEAFRVSSALEELCKEVVKDAAAKMSGTGQVTEDMILSLYLEHQARRQGHGSRTAERDQCKNVV